MTSETLDQTGELAVAAAADLIPIEVPGGPLEHMPVAELGAFLFGALGLQPARFLGCVGDGATQDGAHMNAALQSASDQTLMAPDQYLLDAPVSVPDRTTLSGVAGNPSQPQLGESIYARKSLLRVAQTASPGITLNRGSTLRRTNLVYSGLPAAPTTPAMARAMVAAFAGTGANVVDADASIEDCLIAGFEYGVTVNPNSNPGSGSRFRMRNVRLDTINGVLINSQTDVGHISDVECWPFAAVDINGMLAADYVRNGYGFCFQGAYDSGLAEDLFAFGKTNGFILDGVKSATGVNWLADSADGTTSNNPTALTLRNDTWGHYFNNFRCESQWLGLQLDTSYTGYPTLPTATFAGGLMNSNNILANIQRGNYQFIGCTFGNSGSNPCINVTAQAGNLDFVLPIFVGSTNTPFYFDPAYAGLCSIYLAEPQGPVAGFLGSNIPQSLLESGRITITGPSEQNIEQYIANRPSLQVGPQPRIDMFSSAAPANTSRFSRTVGDSGVVYDQLLNDADDTILGTGLGQRLLSIGGQPTMLVGTDLKPPFANVAAAKAAGLVAREYYFDTTLGYDVQIRS